MTHKLLWRYVGFFAVLYTSALGACSCIAAVYTSRDVDGGLAVACAVCMAFPVTLWLAGRKGEP